MPVRRRSQKGPLYLTGADVAKQSKRAAIRGERSRRRPEPARRRHLPILPIAVAGVAAVIVLGLLLWYKLGTGPGPGQPIGNIHCDAGEQNASLYHAHVTILYQETPVPVPANIGVQSSCLYWVHTQDESGIVAVGLPKGQEKTQITLGQMFQVWGQPLTGQKVATLTVDRGQQVRVWVNGNRYHGDPRNIVLSSHKDITIQVGPPFQDPPPRYTWQPTDPKT
jgi:hypothetical protein